MRLLSWSGVGVGRGWGRGVTTLWTVVLGVCLELVLVHVMMKELLVRMVHVRYRREPLEREHHVVGNHVLAVLVGLVVLFICPRSTLDVEIQVLFFKTVQVIFVDDKILFSLVVDFHFSLSSTFVMSLGCLSRLYTLPVCSLVVWGRQTIFLLLSFSSPYSKVLWEESGSEFSLVLPFSLLRVSCTGSACAPPGSFLLLVDFLSFKEKKGSC